jgi:hypothetical protein
MVRGEGLPQQWKDLPLKTRLEMSAGWKALGKTGPWIVADTGELYLRQRFDPEGKEWEFSAKPEGANQIALTVYRREFVETEHGKNHASVQVPVLTFCEDKDTFVSEETLVKIMLVIGHG